MRTRILAGLLALAVAAPGAAPAMDAGRVVELPTKPPAPALELSGLDGETHTLADYAGRLLVVNFWATWCAPCREEFPALDALNRALEGEGATVVAINAGEERGSVERFLQETPVDFPVLLDRDSRAMGRWQVQGLPTTYVVTPDGRIHGGYVGAMDWSAPEVVERLRGLIDAAPEAES